MNIGERIKLFRKRSNLTQKELGEKINVTGTTITRYEKNARTPDINTLKKLAQVFNISLNTLLTSEEQATHELYNDILNWFEDYIGYEYFNDFDQYFIQFEDIFNFSYPNYEQISEDLIIQMLITIIERNLAEFINIFRIHQETILSFSSFNLKLINDKLKAFNLSLQGLKSNLSSDENKTETSNSSYQLQHVSTYPNTLEALQTILNYVRDTSEQKILKLLNYDLNFQKKILDELFYDLEDKMLIEAINKGKITLTINNPLEESKKAEEKK